MKQKRYGILDNISSPADLRGLSYDTLGVLCAALREFIVDSVSQTGGHLASNLGIVELAVALEREFDSSRDRIIYDVGHQCYVHKILTGRRDRFDTLRQYGGLCGFMKPEESITDPCITGHASDSVSVALGMAHARTIKNQKYHVVAVIGDGALTGGMAYEQSFCDDITAYVGRLAPVLRLPGEEEMRSLAEGALRVLRGQQEAGQY